MSDFNLTVVDSTGATVQKTVKIDARDFSIDEGNIEEELCKAGTFLLFYADLAAELEAQAANAKNRLEEIEAFKSVEIRNNGTKVTQGMVDNAVTLDAEVMVYRNNLVQAEKESAKAASLFKAMNQKVECLKALAYRTNKQERNAF